MPGIVGLATTKPREKALPELYRMLDTLRHEDFYDVDIWIDESLGVYVGWSAFRDSFAGRMPVQSLDRNVTLIFSGEDFSRPESIRTPDSSGHGLEHKPLAYLADIYEKDASFPASLNGRFHGLVLDQKRGQVILFNDRYGMHRLYYHQSADSFYFAAEAKAILCVRPELGTLDPQGLAEFISCGCVLQNRTLFQGISVLPGAAKWNLCGSRVERSASYFDRSEWEQQPPLEREPFYSEAEEFFSQNQARYFAGPERIGMSLTGGLDTRMIMAWRHPAPGSLPCYTFAGTSRDCQDVTIARRVAEVCKQPYSTIRIGDEFFRRFPAYAERAVYLTDGCVDVNRSVDLYINEQARQIAPVRMTGNYGGEVMRRIRAFKPTQVLAGLYSMDLKAHFGTADGTYSRLLQSHPLSFTVFEQAPWYHYGLLALEQTQLTVRTPYLDNDFVRTGFRAPVPYGTSHEFCLRLISEGNRALGRIRTDRGLGQNDIRMTVSRAFLELQFKAEYAYDYGMPQWAAPIDRLLAPMRPERLFLGRHKFTHFRVWYRDRLCEYVKEILLDPKALSRPYIQRATVERIVVDHLAGRRNYTLELHKLLTLELIHRLFVERRHIPTDCSTETYQVNVN